MSIYTYSKFDTVIVNNNLYNIIFLFKFNRIKHKKCIVKKTGNKQNNIFNSIILKKKDKLKFINRFKIIKLNKKI